MLAKEAERQRTLQRFWKHTLLHSFKAVNLLFNTVIFGMNWIFVQHRYHFISVTSLTLMALFITVLYCIYRVYGAFHISVVKVTDIASAQVISLLITYVLCYIVECLMLHNAVPIGIVLCCLVVSLLFSVLWSFAAHKLFYKLYSALKTVVVYDVEEAWNSIEGLYRHTKRFNVVNTIDAAEYADRMDELLKQLDAAEAVFVCGLSGGVRNVILKYCIEHNIRIYIRPKIGDVIISGAQRLQMFHVPVLMCRRSEPSVGYVIAKRVMDSVLSAVALVVFSPIFAGVAIAIKAYDHGKIFYKQRRLTKNGKEFDILKFRSMREDAEKDGVARLAAEHDDRITPVGKFIRACRLDELPQLLNILKGDMSIVGPRPERPEIAEQYEKDLPEFNLRLQVKAGLTGYAQVHGKYNTDPYCKLQMDLMYIGNQSMLEDFKLLFQTVQVLFMKESTEGVYGGRVTAMDGNGEKESV